MKSIGGTRLGRFSEPALKHVLIAMATLLVVSGIPTQILSYDKGGSCEDKDPDSTIAKCTTMIQSKRLDTVEQAADLVDRGNAYAKKKEYDRAVQDFDSAITLLPKYAGLFVNRGMAHLDMGHFDEAAQDFDHAIKLKPDYTIAFYLRGRVGLAKRALGPSISDFNQAIELEKKNQTTFGVKPSMATLLYWRGVARRAKGDIQGGSSDIAAATNLDPSLSFRGTGDIP